MNFYSQKHDLLRSSPYRAGQRTGSTNPMSNASPNPYEIFVKTRATGSAASSVSGQRVAESNAPSNPFFVENKLFNVSLKTLQNNVRQVDLYAADWIRNDDIRCVSPLLSPPSSSSLGEHQKCQDQDFGGNPVAETRKLHFERGSKWAAPGAGRSQRTKLVGSL